AADEPTGDVGVDRGGRVERGLAVAQRPGTGLLLAGGEEGDEVERVLQPDRDLVERGPAAVAERGCFLLVELGELGLELEVDRQDLRGAAARDGSGRVLDQDGRLRGQRVE